MSRRIAGIDGLRAIAVTAVFLFHWDVPGAQLGWSGVELFFVVSGYLITGILLRTADRQGYFRSFYIRRALRILPVYWLVMITSAIVLGHGHAGGIVPYYLLYLQNYYPQLATQFVDGFGFNHSWTLAIEEQFYWLWPAIVVLPRSQLRRVLVVLLVSAPVARALAVIGSGNAFAMVATLPAQADALAAGAAIALLVHTGASRQTIIWVGTVSFVSGLALTAALVVRSGFEAFAVTPRWAADPLNALLISGLTAVFVGVLCFVLSFGAFARALDRSPLRQLGRISYGLYLFGTLAELISRMFLDAIDERLTTITPLAALLDATVLLAIAAASWRYVESPILRLKDRFAPTPARSEVTTGTAEARFDGSEIDAGVRSS